MFNAKPIIATALSTDTVLLTLIPKIRMFSSIAAFTATPAYPYLTFFELANSPSMFADDSEEESLITIRLDIWGVASLSVIASHVDRILKTVGFGRNYSIDNDEVLDTGQAIYHKSMSFSGTFTFVM